LSLIDLKISLDVKLTNNQIKKTTKNMPSALFVHGNSAFNVRNGNAMLNDKSKQITAAIFGSGSKDADKIGKGVAKQYGKHDDGFNISSCQFAIHYFLENPDTLQGFVKNLAFIFTRWGYSKRVLFNR
jgi:hypothetical protein